jgi:hypothetical protein
VVKVAMPDCSDASGPGTFNVTLDGKAIDFPVTGVVLEMQGNYQFLHTLDNFVYYYSFGDRVGEMIVSGIGLSAEPALPTTPAQQKGICGLYSLYMENRRRKRKQQISKLVTTTAEVDHCGRF